ncbi:MAG: hypothetical protein QXE84_05275 [Candidatus Nitrosotenuis sp.]
MSSEPKTIIEEYLAKMGLSANYDDKRKQFVGTTKLKSPITGRDYDYPFAITMLPGWVVTEVAIVDLKTAPADISLEKLYDSMLRTNFIIPEVNYALYNSLAVSLAWSKASALSFENFASEFYGVTAGVKVFFEVVTHAARISSPPPAKFTPMYQ